jgi:hypothetical protein
VDLAESAAASGVDPTREVPDIDVEEDPPAADAPVPTVVPEPSDAPDDDGEP